MNNPAPHPHLAFWRGAARWGRGLGLVCSAALLLTACPDPNRPRVTTPMETPTLVRIDEPQGNGWTPVTLAPNRVQTTAAVMPTASNNLRLVFQGPAGTYDAVVQGSLGTPSFVLPRGALAGQQRADRAHYEIANVDLSTNPPTHTMFIKLPREMPDPLNYSLSVFQRSLSSSRPDSAPLIVQLERRPSFVVSIEVVGNGVVTSNPPGLSCGTAPSGNAQTTCSFDFSGANGVQLLPNTGGSGARVSWGADCATITPNQVCTLALNGAPRRVTASFGGGTPATATNCGPAPGLTGFSWVGVPVCPNQGPGLASTRSCDAAGHFCCGVSNNPPGGGTPRCPGAPELVPTCMTVGINSRLIQPGGCYTINP